MAKSARKKTTKAGKKTAAKAGKAAKPVKAKVGAKAKPKAGKASPTAAKVKVKAKTAKKTPAAKSKAVPPKARTKGMALKAKTPKAGKAPVAKAKPAAPVMKPKVAAPAKTKPAAAAPAPVKVKAPRTAPRAKPAAAPIDGHDDDTGTLGKASHALAKAGHSIAKAGKAAFETGKTLAEAGRAAVQSRMTIVPTTNGSEPGAAREFGTAARVALAMPAVGQDAPTFTLPGDLGETLSLDRFRGEKNVLLYFYPKDDTPGCTREACDFQKDLEALTMADTVVIGVSPDSTDSHTKFRKKYGLSFPLASDQGAGVAQRYGVWVEKNNYGKKYMGVQRATFLINKAGKVAATWPRVNVDGHSSAVLAALAKLEE